MNRGKQKHTDKECLNLLRNFYKENNRIPNMKDFLGRHPSDSIISKRFGSWNKALEKAGLKRENAYSKASEYTKEILLNSLHEYYKNNNKIPTTREQYSIDMYIS